MDFRQPYNRSQYISFFRDQLLPEDFEVNDEEIHVSFKPLHIQKIIKIGEVLSLSLNVYEVEHESENDPRVSISRDSFRLMAQYGVQKALILFISKNSKNFRLSLVTIDLKWDEGKKVEREYSNPRRYSFFLGPDTKTHTPEEYLIKEGRVKDFDDLKKRFSIEVVNKEFYTKIAILFTKLAGGQRTVGREKFNEEGSLKLPSSTSDTLKKEFAVRLIGRLVFCWFLKKKRSDKGISLLSEELLSSQSVMNKSASYHHILEPLFFQVLNTPIDVRSEKYLKTPWSQVPFLNGGLFNPGHHDFYKIDGFGISMHLNTLIVPDNWLKEIFEVFETYNFTIDENTSVDVELSIEPEMLGRIFENLLAEINPETGETARKATGSYYTPRPIVEYMVDESLKQYLKTQMAKYNLPLVKGEEGGFLDDNTISRLLSYDDWEINLTDSQKDSILDALDRIKIIDPACGSGAFPMGILHKMLLILQKVDPESKNWMSRQLVKIDNKIVRKELENKLKRENWNYVHKLGIIQSSIYGVDIQPIAVEISKLRFFLSLIVDESIDDKKHNRGIIPLPNLEFKFVAANSLIGLPEFKKEEDIGLFEATDEIATLKKLRDEYFTSYGDEKYRMEKEFAETQSRMFKHAVNWRATDSQTMKLSQWNPFSDEASSWFDPEWMFGIRDGFDVMIANPPYIQIQSFSGRPEQKAWENQKYATYVKTGDVYCLFYEKGFNLLTSNGILTYITSNKWMRANYGKAMRKFFLSNGKVTRLIDFGDSPIFENATTYTNILVFHKSREPQQMKVWDLSDAYETEASLEQLLERVGDGEPLFSEDSFVIAKGLQTQIKKRIQEVGRPLKEWNIDINYGIKTGKNEAFIISGKKKDELIDKDPKSAAIIKPVLRGRDIKRYKADFADLWIIATFPARQIDINKYPAIKDYLKSFGKQLEQSGEAGCRKKTSNKWFEVQDTIAYHSELEKEKIVYAEIVYDSAFFLDSNRYYPEATAFIMTGERLKYLIAILNSKLLTYAFKTFYAGGDLRGNTFRYKKVFLENLPVPKLSLSKQRPFEILVDQILTAKQKDPQANTSALEKKIDEMVYKLYGLTPEEIAIVEGRTNKGTESSQQIKEIDELPDKIEGDTNTDVTAMTLQRNETISKRSTKNLSKVPTNYRVWHTLSKWVKDEMKIYTSWSDFALEISNKLKQGSRLSDKQKADMKKCWEQAVKKGFYL